MDFALFIPILLASIVLHEVAHAWQARREGDDTADRLGRITLNPISHLDPVGSVILPAVLWFGGGIIFGWAKPVPVDPSKFRSHPWGDIRVSLAGIVANLGLAAVLILIAAGLAAGAGIVPARSGGIVDQIIWQGIFLNLLLAVFNLIPIPPLDGSHVMAHLLPAGLRERYRSFGRYGFLVLIGLVFFVPDAFRVLLSPVLWLMGWADSFVRLWA